MKKVLIILSVIIGILLAAGIVLPMVFKDDIKAMIDREIEASVNAYVQFDVDNFSLSIFRNFPNITANMKEFGVANRAPFEGEILFAADEMEVEIDLMSVLFDETPSLSGITLVRPLINIKVLEDGTANYDIAIESEADSTAEESSGEFSLRIDHWEIVDGEMVYNDEMYFYFMRMKGMNHSGSGDFTQDVFDLVTHTTVDSLWVEYEDIMYMEEKRADVDATITISDDISRYTFKENRATINDFSLTFDGWFFMGEDDYDMDISYSAVDNSFRSLLSLVPGVYTSEFENLETEGNLSLEGRVNGKYSDTEMPAFSLAMLVEDGMFKYPDLPTAINNIALDMKVDNPDGVMENTLIDVANFHMDLGNNPIDASVLIENLKDYKTEASVKAKLNLAELATMFPVEDVEMRGIFDMNLTASGTYDSTLSTMPVMRGTMALTDGYIKTTEFPIPMDDLHFTSEVSNPSGKMQDFRLKVEDFTMIMDDEEFHADLLLTNLVNYTWDLSARGGINLANVTRIMPLEGMELAGLIRADLQTRGNYALLEAGRYSELPTSGTVTVSDFTYSDEELPYKVTIAAAEGSFNPAMLRLTRFTGTAGESDFTMTGQVDRYMGYVFNDDMLHGEFTFLSNYLNLNEFMEESGDETSEADTSSYSIIKVPENIDFVLNSRIGKVIYTDMELTDTEGKIIIRNGTVNLDGISFNTLGGNFRISGLYDTRDMDNPRFGFDLNINNLGIREAYSTFTMVKAFAPLAQNITGKLSSDFSVSGILGQNFLPRLSTLDGAGVLKIASAALKDSKLLEGLTSATKLTNTESVTLRDVAMRASIDNGRFNVKPFDVNFGTYVATVEGSTGIDGSIAYDMEMEVPASALGSQLSSVTSTLGIGEVNRETMIPINIGIGGTYRNPKFQLLTSEQSEQMKQAIADRAKEEAKETGKQAVRDLADKSGTGSVLNNLLGSAKDSTATDSLAADSAGTDLKTEVEEKAKDALKSIFNKKKKDGGG